jgi:hypothetical protein
LSKKATIGKVSPISQIGAKEVNCVGKLPKTTAPFSGSPQNTQRKFKEAQLCFLRCVDTQKLHKLGLEIVTQFDLKKPNWGTKRRCVDTLI